MVTKFDHTAPPSYVTVEPFDSETMGYWVNIGGSIRLCDGDYLVSEDNVPVKYVSAADYAAAGDKALAIRKLVGQEVFDSIINALRNSGFSAMQIVSIFGTIRDCVILCQGGEVAGARMVANNATVTANYTAGVKAALLNIIDTALLKL